MYQPGFPMGKIVNKMHAKGPGHPLILKPLI